MLRSGRQWHPRYLICLWLLPILAASCNKPALRSEDELFRNATLSFQRGDLKQAQGEFERGAAAWQDRPESVWLWNYRMLGAEILMVQGRLKDALKLVEPQLPNTAQLSPIEARWKTVQAFAALRDARPDEARTLLDDAQALVTRGGDPSLLPKIMGIRGQLLLSLNRNDEAETELRSALKHAEDQKDFYHQAATLISLGYSRLRSHRYDEAIPLLEHAMGAAERVGASLIESAASTNLGLCESRLGDFDRALAAYKKAVDIQEKVDAKQYLQATLGELGNFYMLQEDPKQAIPYYLRALDLAHKANATSDASKWSGNLAAAFIDAKDWDQAERWNNESIALKEKIKDAASRSYSRLNAAIIASGREQYEKADGLFEETIRSATGNPEMLWAAHAGLGNLFRNTGDNGKVSEHFEKAIRIIENTTESFKDFKVTFPSRLIRFYREYVDALVDQQAEDKALQVAESSRARVLSERLGMGTAAKRPISKLNNDSKLNRERLNYERVAARSGTVFLSYWLAPKRSFLWVITPRTRKLFILPPQQEIESLVASYHTFIQNLRDPMEVGQFAAERLYETLLAPARGLIPSGSRVVIVPDGALHSVNFETLPVPGDPPHYWIEDVTLSIAPSLESPAGVAPLRRPQSLLLIGDPVTGEGEFESLPYASREIRSIEQRMASLEKTVYTGLRAQPEVYRDSRPQSFSMIHFAAHASANRESPLDSAIILSPGADSFKLYARDLIDLPLTADLVTISGCRSAGARVYSGEGLVGFTWAFLQAGAKNVIAGLWDVSDASTAELMDRLYANIAAGMSPADALRDAKLTLIRSGGNFKKPYYWGPFQVYGRGTPPN